MIFDKLLDDSITSSIMKIFIQYFIYFPCNSRIGRAQIARNMF